MKKNKLPHLLFERFKIVFLLLAFLPLAGNSQQIVVNTMANDGQEVALKYDSVTCIKIFPVKIVEDTAYLCWTVQDMTKNGVIILYRSSDGKHFNIIGTKNVYGSFIKNTIVNYFRDADYDRATKYYRLVYINSASEYLVSEKVMVNNVSVSLFPYGVTISKK